jgi:hypothetical protein
MVQMGIQPSEIERQDYHGLKFYGGICHKVMSDERIRQTELLGGKPR